MGPLAMSASARAACRAPQAYASADEPFQCGSTPGPPMNQYTASPMPLWYVVKLVCACAALADEKAMKPPLQPSQYDQLPVIPM